MDLLGVLEKLFQPSEQKATASRFHRKVRLTSKDAAAVEVKGTRFLPLGRIDVCAISRRNNPSCASARVTEVPPPSILNLPEKQYAVKSRRWDGWVSDTSEDTLTAL